MLEEKVLYNASVCLLTKDNRILLAIKTIKIGKGFLNGYGGGIEEGEKPIESAVRELNEETDEDENKGVIALTKDLEKIAIVDFHNTKTDGESFVCKVHFYLVYKWKGKVNETKEMINPTWYDIDNLPLDQMMPADKYWLPPALNGKKIIAKASLGPFQKELIWEVKIKEVDNFPSE